MNSFYVFLIGIVIIITRHVATEEDRTVYLLEKITEISYDEIFKECGNMYLKIISHTTAIIIISVYILLLYTGEYFYFGLLFIVNPILIFFLPAYCEKVLDRFCQKLNSKNTDIMNMTDDELFLRRVMNSEKLRKLVARYKNLYMIIFW